MDEQPQGTPDEGGDAPPPFFKNINGIIAGATGLVIAVGGLFTAYNGIWGKKQAEQSPAAVEQPAEAAAPVAAAALPKDEDLPTYYEGDDAALEFVDNKWVLTTSEGTYEYKEMLSPDEDRVLAFDMANKEYLRWPVKGGMSETSKDDESWTKWIALDPVSPPEDGSDTAE